MQPIWVFPHGSMFHGCKYLISPIWTTTMYYETHFLSRIIEKNVCHVLLTVILTSVLSRQFTCYWFTAFWLNVYTVWGRHKKWPQEKWGYIRFGLSVILSVILSVCHHFVSTQYLENNFIEFTQFCMCIDIDLFFRHDLEWDFTHHFSDICTRVISLDLFQNFVSAQYLEKRLTDFHQILYICIYIDKI